jgi:hypothetical protein
MKLPFIGALILIVTTGCKTLSSFSHVAPQNVGDIIVRIDTSQVPKKSLNRISVSLIDEPRTSRNWDIEPRINLWLTKLQSPTSLQLDEVGHTKFIWKVDSVHYHPTSLSKNKARPIIGVLAQGECEKIWLVFFDANDKLKYYHYNSKDRAILEEASEANSTDITGNFSELIYNADLKRGPTQTIDLKIEWKVKATCGKSLKPAKSIETGCKLGHKPIRPDESPICD